MRNPSRIWVRADNVYKWHVDSYLDSTALCGTATNSLYQERQTENNLTESECCKTCWKISGK